MAKVPPKFPKKAAARPAKTAVKVTTEPTTTDNSGVSGDSEGGQLAEDDIPNLKGRDFSALISQVQSEYDLAWWFMKPKWDEWALRLKLYNNQKRDKSAVGDPLLFTIHQTVLASLYDDQLMVAFEPREEGDTDTAENLNSLADYDYDEMEKDIVDYTWDWDTTFFGRGLVMLMEFNKAKQCPIPENWDPMVTLRDPNAKSVNGDAKGRGKARFIGREIRLTMQEMKDSGVYFNFDNLKADTTAINSLVDRNQQLRAAAQGYSDILRFNGAIKGDNATFRLLEWITNIGGKLVMVTLADNRKRVVRYTVLKGNRIPIIDRALYPIAHDWDGVSIPDLVEDKQRARAKLLNLGLKVAEAELFPMYLFDNTRITNRAELNFEQNKFIGVPGNTNGAVSVVPKDGLKADVNYILNSLNAAAQSATATPDIQQGQVGTKETTATELELVDKKVDTRYSLSAKVFGWSEKRFWQQWYMLYKTYFLDGIDQKTLRITGALGYSFRPLRRENIIAAVDPDIKIESKVVSDQNRYAELQIVRGYVQMIAQDPNTNLRFAFKYMGKLSGIKKDVLDQMLPPTVDEMIADEENERLEKNQLVQVQLTDDHMAHLEEHNKASDTPAKYAHMQAHKRAMILKKTQPQLFPQAPQQMNATGGQGVGDTPLPTMVANRGRSVPSSIGVQK